MTKETATVSHVLRSLVFFALAVTVGLSLNTALRAQNVSITSNPGTSGNIVIGGSNHHAMEAIYLESEIGAANFTTPATAITAISFNTNVPDTAPTVAPPNFRVYLMEVPLGTTTLATGVYSTAGYTLVYTGAFSYPQGGWHEVILTTPFVRTTGNNLQVLIERIDGVVHAGNNFFASVGNTAAGSGAITSRRYNGTTAPVSGTTSFTQSAFRPMIQFEHKVDDDIEAGRFYTLSELPIPVGNPHTVSVQILNDGLLTKNNFPVTLTVSGANAFTDTQMVATLAPNARTFVTFAPYSSTATGVNTLTLNVGPDSDTTDDVSTFSQTVTNNSWSYKVGTQPFNAVGFPGATADFVVKYSTNVPLAIDQVTSYFLAAGQPFTVGIWDATGPGGTPGTRLFTSAPQAAVAGANATAVAPAQFVTAGNFYVGLSQTATASLGIGYQTESPIRTQTFYFTSPSGNAAWTDFAPGNPFRMMIDARFVPASSAEVSVGGRVLDSGGRALRGQNVSLTDQHGVTRRAVSSSFGYYGFDNVRSGETYILNVNSKRYVFTPRTVVISEEVGDLDITAEGGQFRPGRK